MMQKRSTGRLGTWLAMLAMALNVLWPLLARAGDGALIELCSSTGMKWVAADGSDPQPKQERLAPHCEFCSLGADRAPLPSAPAVAPIRGPIAVAVVAPGKSASVASQFRLSPALPRAPPVLS